MQNKIIILLCFQFLLLNRGSAQQPSYKPESFVSAYDDSEFKATVPLKEGLGITYLVTEAEIWDTDENQTTHVRGGGRPILMRIEGNYKKSMRDGVFTFSVIDSADHSKSYRIWEQTFSNDKLNGTWKVYNLKGTLVFLQTYKNDSLDGITREYWIDGATVMQEREYFGGKRKFIAKSFFKSGKIESETTIENGTQTGLTRKYYEAGHVQQELVFKNGVPNGPGKKFYPDGKLQEEVYLVEGQFDKIRKYYHPNGQLWVEQEYKAGKPWRIIGNWDEKGNIRSAGTLNDGTGTILLYNADGTVRETLTYVNGIQQ